MSEVGSSSRIKNIVLTSPYFLLLFLVIPAGIIISHLLRLPYTLNLMLANNIGFLVIVALRLIWYLQRLRTPAWYGAENGVPAQSCMLVDSKSAIRSALHENGYRFNIANSYGERHDAGYFGTVILYAGLALLLFFGTYDNVMQFTGVVRLGIGDPKSISKPDAFADLVMGPAASPGPLPLLQIRKIILPNTQWPKGALEIGFWDKNDHMLMEGVTAPGKTLFFDGFEYSMLKFSNVAEFMVLNGMKQIVFNSLLSMLPLPKKMGEYSFHTTVDDPAFDKIKGDAWFNTDKKKMKVVLTRDGKPFLDTELELWGGNSKTQGDYTASFSRLGEFAEIRVAHVRHFMMLKIGAVVALIGGLLRLAVRPQRVWLVENESGCTAKVIGAKTRKMLEELAER